MSEEGVITQVQHPSHEIGALNASMPEIFHLDMRGQRFSIDREELLELPESVLFCLSAGIPGDDGSQTVSMEESHDVMHVDFSPECFQYVLGVYEHAMANMDPRVLPLSSFNEFEGFVDSVDEESGVDSEPNFHLHPAVVPDILKKRPALIVLREELEYYCLNGDPNVTQEAIDAIKRQVGAKLVNARGIFEGLRGLQITDSPEFHLMQMLCLAGFEATNKWSFREREPYKTTLLSFQVTPLRLPADDNLEEISAAQKLLMFWKKPARKCWWDNFDMDLNGEPIKIHARRVWTLELSVLGVVNE